MGAEDRLRERMALFGRVIETRDAALATDVLDDEFCLVLVHPTPATMPASRWIEVLPDYVVSRYDVVHADLAIDGDCATVLQRVEMDAVVLGDDRRGTFVITDVWRLRGDTWRVWRRHSTPLSAGPMPGAAEGSPP